MGELIEVPADYVREKFLGGSDIAGVLNISPWQTPVSVWQRKTGMEPEREPRPGKKKLFNRGKMWEKVVGEMLIAELEAREHRVVLVSTNHRYRDPRVPYFASEIDYEILLDDIPDTVNVELKTVHPNAAGEWGESDTDQCPVHYAAQAMWGLGVTGRKCCVVAPLFGADEIRVYPIIRDDEVIDGMRRQALQFWERHVMPRIAPEPTTLEDVDRLFKLERDTFVTATPEMLETVLKYRAAQAMIVAKQEELALSEFQIKQYLRDATALMMEGGAKPIVTWKNRANAHLDQARFKSEYPKLHAQFMVRGQSRVFQVKKFAASGGMEEEEGRCSY